jgi:periplasmic copper chaperone A
MKRMARAVVISVGVLAIPVFAHAHVGVISGPATANTNQEITFGVGHGCDGADTYRVRIEIPAGVGAILPLTSDFGKITLEKDAAGVITAVTWQKPDADILPSDSEYYNLLIRMRTPNQPFRTIYFPVIQTCKKTDGTLLTTRWVGKPGDPPLPDGGFEEPAASLPLMPARHPGWNKYTVPVAIPTTALGSWFGNAIIVWKGNAAFSANPNTTELIKNTAGVTALDSLQANDEIWVRY